MSTLIGRTGTRTSTTSIPNSLPTASTPIATPTHSIAVGADGFVFSPKVVSNVSIGDIVEFHFFPGGHAVTRAEYKFPCIPYEYTGTAKKGFTSGTRHPQVISYEESNFYRVRINDTFPIFFYCSIPGSCKNEQMIGAINPVIKIDSYMRISTNSEQNQSQTIDVQLAHVLNTSLELGPGDPFPSETPEPTTQSSVSAKNTLNTGQIVGIILGIAGIVVIGAILFYMFGRKKRNQPLVQEVSGTARSGESPFPPAVDLLASPGGQTLPEMPFKDSNSPSTDFLHASVIAPEMRDSHLSPILRPRMCESRRYEIEETLTEPPHHTSPIELPSSQAKFKESPPTYHEVS